jgi:predicted DNA-binding protein (MmcQ/YjbR family)
MTAEDILNYCLAKPGAHIDFPFGDIPVCVKVGNRLFAQLYPKQDDFKITLNCDRVIGEMYRNSYPDAVTRGYHCPPAQQPYFNTVRLSGVVPEDELKKMIDHSYATVVKKLPKQLQHELRGGVE